jgi:hypothetical protein
MALPRLHLLPRVGRRSAHPPHHYVCHQFLGYHIIAVGHLLVQAAIKRRRLILIFNLVSYVHTSNSCDHIEKSNDGPPEWEDITPDLIIKHCKQVPSETIKSIALRDFNKSYSSWHKLTQEQKNKCLAWFHTIPDDLQGWYSLCFVCFFLFVLY